MTQHDDPSYQLGSNLGQLAYSVTRTHPDTLLPYLTGFPETLMDLSSAVCLFRAVAEHLLSSPKVLHDKGTIEAVTSVLRHLHTMHMGREQYAVSLAMRGFTDGYADSDACTGNVSDLLC